MQLEVAEPDLESLRNAPRTWVPATLREGDRVYTNLTLHLKGSVGSFRKVDDKPSLTLKFEGSSAQDAFHGLKKLHLNNSVQDPSFLSDWLCSPLFRAAAVPTPRSTHALVDLNGRKLGLYVLLESADKDFLARYFTNTQGNLYGQSLNADITAPLERMSGKGENTREDLKALAAVMQETDRAKLWEKLPQVLDVDRYLSFMAMEVMLCHWDGYTFATHNYRVYQDLPSGRMVFLPHDFDFMLEDPAVPVLPGANGMVSACILKAAPSRKLYQERFGTLFTNIFVVPALTQRIDQRLSMMLPMVRKYDAELAHTMETHAETLKGRVEKRAASLAQQLSGPLIYVPFIHGLVLDADTQKPVAQCMITSGFGEDESNVRWDRSRVYVARRGIFDMDMAGNRMAATPNFLRFETPGYLPYVLKITQTSEDEDPVYRIVLKKGGKISGEVRLPEGGRAWGGQAALITESGSPALARGNFLVKPGLQAVQLRELARFNFSLDPEARAVVAAHPQKGFAQVSVEDLAGQSQIILKPWGRIEGNVSNGWEAVAMLTSDLAIPRLFKGFANDLLELDSTSYTVDVLSDAPFVFEQVPPGERYLWRTVPIDKPNDLKPSNLGFNGCRLQVKSGQTNILDWGAGEKAIKGRLELEEAAALPVDPDVIAFNETPLKIGQLKVFESPNSKPLEFFFTFNDKDAFRVMGHFPEAAKAEIRVYNPPILLGAAQCEARFAAGSAMVDLGSVKMPRIAAANPGDPAPNFALEGLDGRSLKLADYKGTLLVLNFTAMGAGTAAAGARALSEAGEKWPGNSPVAVVNLSLDHDPETALRLARRHKSQGRQAWIGRWFQTDLPAKFGVASIPSLVLISPDGKLLARDVPPAQLVEQIQAALAAAEPAK